MRNSVQGISSFFAFVHAGQTALGCPIKGSKAVELVEEPKGVNEGV
jgi:hypothetical protein